MKFAVEGFAIAALIAACPLAASRAEPLNVSAVVAGEADDTSATPGGESQRERVRSTMDRVFGAGRWRQTSGYRTPAQEDALRREGAGTVRPGRLSHHSLGSPGAPGAYDIVVPGMSSRSAAAKLRSAGPTFTRVFAEAAHGPQGPHLHVEPGPALASGPSPVAVDDEIIYSRIVGGRRNPLLERASLGRGR
jgi:hypothetical protein